MRSYRRPTHAPNERCFPHYPVFSRQHRSRLQEAITKIFCDRSPDECMQLPEQLKLCIDHAGHDACLNRHWSYIYT